MVGLRIKRVNMCKSLSAWYIVNDQINSSFHGSDNNDDVLLFMSESTFCLCLFQHNPTGDLNQSIYQHNIY